MKKNSGFSLVELLVVLSIIGVLSSFITPKFMTYSAKSKETKAIATLEALRTASEFYYLENGESFLKNDGRGKMTKQQLYRLQRFLSNNASKLIKDNKVVVEIGGSRKQEGGIIKYGGEIGFTTAKPEESSSFENGVSIWFDDTDVGKFNMNNDKWVDL